MEIRPIRTEIDYQLALKAVVPYFDQEPEPGPTAADHFELLLMMIEAYETKIHAIDAPDPVEAIKFRMEQAGLSPKDLQPMIGQTNRVYEVLNYTRPLTLAMIRRLNATLGIPADALIGESKLCNRVASKHPKVASSIPEKQANVGSVIKAKSAKPIKRTDSKTSKRKVILAR